MLNPHTVLGWRVNGDGETGDGSVWKDSNTCSPGARTCGARITTGPTTAYSTMESLETSTIHQADGGRLTLHLTGFNDPFDYVPRRPPAWGVTGGESSELLLLSHSFGLVCDISRPPALVALHIQCDAVSHAAYASVNNN
ncbi:hypothetical protein EYF80_016244 [Liparis tanakae]|uniref:Uncharacterized protein n=1 Tax=Liparis tanakae TaxID=230148 RepID=A0A4Z2I7Y9_9TELE|nr:hypothetical protein EYF80_016244 [Liparis tanakae]